jgi:hypothetical protein
MNRRGFLASLVALAVAPAVKTEPVRWISGLPPREIRLSRAEAEEVRKVAIRNSAGLKALSYGQGGFFRPLGKW